MSEKELKKIYENVKKNSVGPEKKTSAIRDRRTVKMKITTDTLIGVLALAGLTGYLLNTKIVNKDEITQTFIESIDYKSEYNGYSDMEISTYERLRTLDLLEENGLTKYQLENSKRSYNYSVEDYKKISDLDKTYLYGLYTLVTPETFNNILKALGYENLEAFLTQNNYVDESGNGSALIWSIKDLEEMSVIMTERTKEKGLK